MATPVEQMTDTRINVVDFFKAEAMGRVRRYTLDLPTLDLDNDLVARNVHAEFRLLRVGGGLLAEGTVRANVVLECVRTLEPYSQPVETEFAEQFRPLVDVVSGRELTYDEPEEFSDIFDIDENHLLDVREALRQNLIVALPIAPVKPGTEPVVLDETGGGAVEAARNPFAVLGALLQDEGE